MLTFFYMIGILVIILFIFNSRLNKKDYSPTLKKESFIERERKASVAKKKELDEGLFIYPDKSKLEFLDLSDFENNPNYKKLIKTQKMVQRKIELEMIQFDKEYTNTYLMEMYGARNLDKLILFEEHYNSYITALYDWSLALWDLNFTKEAIMALEEAVRINSNQSKIYFLLSDFLFKEKDIVALKNLNTKIMNSDYRFKGKVSDKINSYQRLLNS